ncbi:TonB-dependent receptor [Sphingosinicella rhizophila]|uniref:TonB-dependent receptor n=1 Tax=Sphingosinicella rhizophila TaxID=3050082 RepID=A0ABU3Q717_9SPHN|nr:TonB-dependent receptor [Sphingosinicella sp. GR2756]MDT9599196.1 TonB-dependent receptor [Sphingosinicella sp. GR2756]
MRKALITLGLLIGGGTAAFIAAAPAVAQPATAKRSYDIPSQRLDLALNSFAEQSRLQIMFDPALVRGRRSAALQGSFLPSDGLRKLLAGSGLVAARGAGGVYMVKSGQGGGDTSLSTGEGAATGSVSNDAAAMAGTQDMVGEIVVTAQKRSENLLDVPSSVSVVGSEQLERFNATQLSDFAGYVPGFIVAGGGIPGAARLSLRGIASNTSATVATYVDEVPLGSSSSYGDRGSLSLDLFPYDVARVEVLRGPQGTLYGANAMGGLLKYTTVLPDANAFEARLGADLFDIGGSGSLGWGIRGAVNIPLATDVAGVRLSYFRQRNPGFIDNRATGEEDVNVGRQEGGRIALLLRPAPDLSLKLSAVRQNLDYDGGTAITVTLPDRRPVDSGLSRSDVLPTPYRQRLTVLNGTIDWDLGGLSLVSSTSYARSHTNSRGGFADLLPIFGIIGALNTDNRMTKFTQELRLVSPTGASFEWMAGGFYTRENYRIRQTGDAIFPDGTPADAFNPLLDAGQPSRYVEYALFGNATYRLTDRLELGGGLRWTKDRQLFGQTNTGFLFNPADPTSVLTVETRASEDVVNYMASAQYRFGRDAMLYARVASGYRPGGPNIVFPGAPAKFDSDSLTNYEAGIKSEFWDRRARIDLSLFYIDWKDMQVVLTTPSSIPYFVNASEKTISKGAEFSAQLVPVEGLRLNVNMAYTDATIRGDVPGLRARAGDRVPNVPRWTASATADYFIPIGPDLDLTFAAGYRYVGERRSRFTSDPVGVDLGDYGILDASMSVSTGVWTARIYARNLADKRGFSTDGGAVAGGFRNLAIITPRTIGIALDTRF